MQKVEPEFLVFAPLYMVGLEEMSLERLWELLAIEEQKTADVMGAFRALEQEVQETDRLAEQEEESIVNLLHKGMTQLKEDNQALAARIAKEEEYVRTTLTEKLSAVLKDKEDLQAVLTYQESQVIDRLQADIDRLTKEALRLESRLSSSDVDIASIDTGSIDESLTALLKESEKAKQDYETELAALRQEIERLVTANTILIQRVSAGQIELATIASSTPAGNPGGTAVEQSAAACPARKKVRSMSSC
jgi:hypothetical protein